MENVYHEDVVIFFSTEMLEGILDLFKHANYLKGGVHRIMSLGKFELVFSSDDCLVRERVKNGEEQQNGEKTPSGKPPQNGEGKQKPCNFLFNNKNVNDERELICEEITKCLYGGHKSSKGAHKRKLLTTIIIQAILFANRIGLDVYKINLFLSIILMIMHRIRDNLKEKKGRKLKTIKYFFHLMSKNVNYGWTADPTGECTYVQDGSSSMNSDNLGRPSNQVGTKEGEYITSTKQPLSVNVKQKPGEDTNNANGASTNELGKKQMEDNREDPPPLETDEQRPVCTQFILFHFEEAKNIIKYFFENIFSIYNMIEYLFLFSPVCVHVAHGGGFSPASPPGCLFTSDALKLGEAANTNDDQMVDPIDNDEYEELATNIYIKDALDVPLFVLNKFYSNVDQLERKIDQVLA
ncbi:Uncharacterized protein PCOAH_00014580 [Plasmodium coatneyi]|uniref:Uncharacterized protein n=1 Tax=Plasmodium coatneyi TaxID=208452 RepID=A0A1B1DWH7_9APIC|nr:Uncharacterized protein PCOAH_00014580 [Plasmodium coatneyi]ANQ07146.1 Uncharacterized protein PCOAH_00014580 [Plasmodium coatneyi]